MWGTEAHFIETANTCLCRLTLITNILKCSEYNNCLLTMNVLFIVTCVCLCIVVIWEEENQLDVTQRFIELAICSTCFGNVYAHHQEFVTILLASHVACNSWLLVVGRSGIGQEAMRPG